VHFYSSFWSYACSNRDAGKLIRPPRRRPRPQERCAARGAPFPGAAPSRGGTHAEGLRSLPCPPARAPERAPPWSLPLPACPPSYPPWYLPDHATPARPRLAHPTLKAPLLLLGAQTPPSPRCRAVGTGSAVPPRPERRRRRVQCSARVHHCLSAPE
jgi:hypothetical protein